MLGCWRYIYFLCYSPGRRLGSPKSCLNDRADKSLKVLAKLELPHVKGCLHLDNARSDDNQELVRLAFVRLASRLEAGAPRIWG